MFYSCTYMTTVGVKGLTVLRQTADPLEVIACSYRGV